MPITRNGGTSGLGSGRSAAVTACGLKLNGPPQCTHFPRLASASADSRECHTNPHFLQLTVPCSFPTP